MTGRVRRPRILFATRHCYLDDSNGAAISSRELMQMLAGRGLAVEVLSSISMDLAIDVNPFEWFSSRGWAIDVEAGHSWDVGVGGIETVAAPHLKAIANGVPVTLYQGKTTDHHPPDEAERRDFLHLFDAVADRFRPDVVVGYGGDQLQGQIFARAKARGLATMFNLHNCRYGTIEPFVDVDVVRVPSRYAAAHYRKALGLDCVVLPNPIDVERIRIDRWEPRYVTFVNPTIEKGVCVFARIADAIGEVRPDIPFLVVESLGTERTVAACGLDLRRHGNVFFMGHTPDPRQFYRVSRMMLIPSLVAEAFGRVAAEAACNGIPVLASDRGALPEILAGAGTTRPLPAHLTSRDRRIPTAEELKDWIGAIIAIYDRADDLEAARGRARHHAGRWSASALCDEYEKLFKIA